MPDEAAFLEAIRASPDDDAPRLIYADWLSEQNDEATVARGEFVRTQIAKTALEEWSPEWHALHLREAELRRAAIVAWEAPHRALGVVIDLYERGLPSRLRLSAKTLLEHREELTRLTPGWRGLALHGSGDPLARVLDAAPPEGVRHFGFHSVGFEPQLTFDDVWRISISSWLPLAESLSLGGSPLGPELDVLLAALSSLSRPALRTLDLDSTDLDDDVARGLAAHSILRSLHALDLSSNPLGDAIPALVAACRPGVLRSLRLTSVESIDVASLVALPAVATLESLHLGNNDLGGRAAALFSSGAPPTRWRRLSLFNAGLSAEDVSVAARTGNGGLFAGALTRLDLSHNRLGDRAVARLVAAGLVDRLSALSLSATALGASAVRAIVERPRPTRLRRLHLADNWLDDASEAALRNAPTLSDVVDLQTGARGRSAIPDFDV